MNKPAETLDLMVPMLARRLTETWPGVTGVEKALGAALMIKDTFLAEVASIRANADLTEVGKSKALRGTSQAALRKLVEFEKDQVTGRRAGFKQLEGVLAGRAAIQRPTDVAERVAYEMRLAEIRSPLRGLEPMMRLRIYLEATDSAVVDAIETAPPTVEMRQGSNPALVPFVDPSRVAEKRLDRLRAFAEPKELEQLERINELCDAYDETAKMLREVITSEGFADRSKVEAFERIAAGTATPEDLALVRDEPAA